MYQVYTDPNLVAQLQAQGGRDLAHGISSGVASLVKGFQEGIEERKRIGQLAKASEGALKSLTEEQRAELKLPDPETFALMSGKEKIATWTGAQQAQGYQRAQQEMAVTAAHLKQLQANAANEKIEPEFYKNMARYAQPGDLPYNISQEEFQRYALPEGQARPDIKQYMAEEGRTGYRLPPKEMFEMLTKRNALDLPTAFEMARNPPSGFQPGQVNVNPNGTPGLQFQPAGPTTPPHVPTGLDTKTVVVGPDGKATTTYGITDRSKALTDAQANALQFSERMKFNNGIIEHLEEQGFSPASAGGAAQGALPNFLAGEASQQYTAAAQNWISAVLRKESGAAISKSEETAARSQYFPKFGDSPAVIKQKAKLRHLAEENMRRATGNIDKDADAARRIDDVRKAVDGSLPTATRTSEKTKGSVYQTPRGPLKWTGTGWETP